MNYEFSIRVIFSVDNRISYPSIVHNYVESGEKCNIPKMIFWCFFIRNDLSRVDLIIKVVLEFLSNL